MPLSRFYFKIKIVCIRFIQKEKIWIDTLSSLLNKLRTYEQSYLPPLLIVFLLSPHRLYTLCTVTIFLYNSPSHSRLLSCKLAQLFFFSSFLALFHSSRSVSVTSRLLQRFFPSFFHISIGIPSIPLFTYSLFSSILDLLFLDLLPLPPIFLQFLTSSSSIPPNNSLK